MLCLKPGLLLNTCHGCHLAILRNTAFFPEIRHPPALHCAASQGSLAITILACSYELCSVHRLLQPNSRHACLNCPHIRWYYCYTATTVCPGLPLVGAAGACMNVILSTRGATTSPTRPNEHYCNKQPELSKQVRSPPSAVRVHAHHQLGLLEHKPADARGGRHLCQVWQDALHRAQCPIVSLNAPRRLLHGTRASANSTSLHGLHLRGCGKQHATRDSHGSEFQDSLGGG